MENLANNMNYEKADGIWVDFDLNVQKAFDLVPTMVWILFDDAHCVYLNQAWKEYTGKSSETGLGREWLNAIHPDDIVHCLAHFNSCFETAQPLSIEIRIKDKSGNYHWHLTTGKPYYDGSEKMMKGFICSAVNIQTCKESEESMRINVDILSVKQTQESLEKELRERKILETQLHNEQELFKTIFDTIPVMLSIWNPDLNVTHLNKAVEKVTGWGEDDYKKKALWSLLILILNIVNGLANIWSPYPWIYRHQNNDKKWANH